jgi:pimeloyl-ACP methyl ester carboxylesterase
VEESFVRADDGTQLYLRERPGPPGVRAPVALLCDGIACDGFIWKYLWESLATRTRVAHFHYRGHGRSKAPADPANIRVENLAADLASVREALRGPDGSKPEVVLFGHSMGCQVVLEHMRAHAEGVRGIVLICGAPGRVTHTFKDSDALARFLPRAIEAVDKHPRLARALFGSVPPEISLRVAMATGEIDKDLMDPRDLLPYLEHMVDIDLPMFLRMLQAAGEHTAEDLLPAVRVPALVIAGDRDSFTPSRLAEQMAAALPNGELCMMSATHVAPLEQRVLVEEKINALYDRLEPPQETRATPA